jgi:hypothetical protein
MKQQLSLASSCEVFDENQIAPPPVLPVGIGRRKAAARVREAAVENRVLDNQLRRIRQKGTAEIGRRRRNRLALQKRGRKKLDRS